jgi:hypothetical protein
LTTTSADSEARRFQNSVKISPPVLYNGQPDFDAFEHWLYSLNHYFSMTEFPEIHRVPHLQNFLTGRAATFFMTFVAPDPTAFTVDRFTKELFDYCFPPDFRRNLRKKFYAAEQGKRSVCEYLRELRTLASRLLDVTPFQLTQRFWESTQPYLRVAWYRDGLDPERSTLEELEVTGIRFERAERASIEVESSHSPSSKHADRSSSSKGKLHDSARSPDHARSNQSAGKRTTPYSRGRTPSSPARTQSIFRMPTLSIAMLHEWETNGQGTLDTALVIAAFPSSYCYQNP